jgi:hypothetical protein
MMSPRETLRGGVIVLVEQLPQHAGWFFSYRSVNHASTCASHSAAMVS